MNKLLLTLFFLPIVFGLEISPLVASAVINALANSTFNVPLIINTASILYNNSEVLGLSSIPARIISSFGSRDIVVSTANSSLSISDLGLGANINVAINVPNSSVLIVQSSMFIESGNNRYEIKVMPSDAAMIANATTITNLTIMPISSAIKYVVEDTRQVKLFGLFPVNITVSSTIDAFSGELELVKKPWWTIFSLQTS